MSAPSGPMTIPSRSSRTTTGIAKRGSIVVAITPATAAVPTMTRKEVVSITARLRVSTEAAVGRDRVRAFPRVEDRIVGGLDPVAEAHGVEDLDVAIGLGVVDDTRDLERAPVDQPRVVWPDFGRVHERGALGVELDQEVETDGAIRDTRAELVEEVVAAPRAGVVVGDSLLVAGIRPPPESDPGSIAVRVEIAEGVGRVVVDGREARRWLDAHCRGDRRLRLGMLAEPSAELLHVRLAGLRVGLAQPQELEKVIGRPRGERARCG